jgi:ceramide glucosyltransferase
MATLILVAAVLIGLGLTAVMGAAQRRLLAAPRPLAPQSLPAVSVLKPLKGADAGFEENLASFFRLEYPQFELLFGVDRPADPALAVVQKVAARHPAVPCRIVIDSRRVGFNPKVNNLANLERHARHEVIWISDSNTRVAPATLSDLVAHLEQPGVGLVSSPFRGVEANRLGAASEALQLNTFVMGGVAAVHRLWGGVCVVGKSMLLRRTTLAAIGGFAFLSQFLAEDQVCGEEVVRAGQRVAVTPLCIDNVLGPVPVRAFLARHLRWAKIRRRMNPAAYAGEVLLNPVLLALAGALTLHNRESAALLAAALVVKSGLDALAEHAIGVPRPLLHYPALTFAKDLLVGVAWLVPFFSTTVSWRGNRLRVGPRTLLVPLPTRTPDTTEPIAA